MSQSAVVDALNAVEMGAPHGFRNLTITPLLARQSKTPGYVTLDEALANGWVTITEVGESGTVPELSLTNSGPMPVLLLDGEELVGAKQNRVLNLTILVAAQSTLVIPVSCVEAGRWRHVSHRFTASPRTQFAEGRAAKMRNVTQSLRHSGTRRSNQGEVWDAIEAKALRLGAESETRAMSAVFEQLEMPVETFVNAFHPDPRQAGALFAINGRIVGLELFDSAATWAKLAPKLIRSYAVDAIDRTGESHTPPSEEAQRFMAAIAASDASAFPATGIGADVRLSSPSLTGAALVAEGSAVHVSAFAEPGI